MGYIVIVFQEMRRAVILSREDACCRVAARMSVFESRVSELRVRQRDMSDEEEAPDHRERSTYR